MEKYLIKTYDFFQIPHHEKFKESLKKQNEDTYEFMIVFAILTLILGILTFYYKKFK